MARSCLFSFAAVSEGYFISNGKEIYGSHVPPSLIDAITADLLKDLKSISIEPGGGWIVCYSEAAKGGPDGDNYHGADVPKPLEDYLGDHADENQCNPVQWIKLGPDEQFFVRRLSTMDWQISESLQGCMKKLKAIGAEQYLEEVVFGPDDTAIFIFNNGSFLWDLPESSEAHELLQRCFSVGTHLEAAALSFVSPEHYFFFWGHGRASYHMPDACHEKVDTTISDCCITRMHWRMLQSLVLDCASVVQQGSKVQVDIVLAGDKPDSPAKSQASELVRLTSDGSFDMADADNASYMLDQMSHVSRQGPRRGSGNLRKWHKDCKVFAVEQ